MQGAEIKAMRSLLGHICQLLPLKEIEQCPIPRWLRLQAISELEKALIAIEDKNPERAAQLQAMIDDAKRRADDFRS
jgi:hypothetical protein